MPRLNPSSLAALSRLSQPFSPTLQVDEDPEAEMNDQVESATGLNPTAMQEMGLARLRQTRAAADDAEEVAGNRRRRDDAAFLGPEGWARSTPADADFARQQEQKRLGVQLGSELLPEEERQRDIMSEGVAGRRLMPNAERVGDEAQRDKLEQLRNQFQIPAEDRATATVGAANARAEGLVNTANAKANAAERRNAALLGILKNGKIQDEHTGLPRAMTPDEMLGMARKMGAMDEDLPQGGGMPGAGYQDYTGPDAVQMQAPDGSVRPVDPAHVAAFEAKGARRLQ